MIKNLPNISKIQSDIHNQGFSISNNLINEEVITELKKYWVDKFKNIKADKKHVGWNF